MTAFFTRYCKKSSPGGHMMRRWFAGYHARIRRTYLSCAFCLMSLFFLGASLGVTPVAHAEGIEAKQASIVTTDEHYALSAQFNIDLGRRLEDVITHGIPLYFDFETVIERPRKYWVNEHIVTRSFMYRLSYHSLTQQYRLARVTNAIQDGSSLYQNFEKLGDALRAMSRINGLPLVERRRLMPGETYVARVRLSLNQNQLPKPFQIDALTNSDWRLSTKTNEWSFVASTTANSGGGTP